MASEYAYRVNDVIEMLFAGDSNEVKKAVLESSHSSEINEFHFVPTYTHQIISENMDEEVFLLLLILIDGLWLQRIKNSAFL